MKRLAMWSGALVVCITAVGFAASVHLKGGAHSEPTFTDNGLTLTAAGELAGLGFGDVLVTLTATGKIGRASCREREWWRVVGVAGQKENRRERGGWTW